MEKNKPKLNLEADVVKVGGAEEDGTREWNVVWNTNEKQPQFDMQAEGCKIAPGSFGLGKRCALTPGC